MLYTTQIMKKNLLRHANWSKLLEFTTTVLQITEAHHQPRFGFDKKRGKSLGVLSKKETLTYKVKLRHRLSICHHPQQISMEG